MNKESYTILDYLKEKKSYIFFMLMWIFLFYLIFMLHDLDTRILGYPVLVCITISLAYFLVDYIKYYHKLNKLRQMYDCIELSLNNISEATTALEFEYQELLEALLTKKNQEINQYHISRKDTTEYITLWAHQIKIPITALHIMAQDFEKPVKDDFLKRLFELEEYVDLILQYLRLEGDDNDFVFEKYSLKDIVNQAVKYYARIFISKGISVNIDIPEDLKIITDEKWLVFAIKQLISNALKYTNKGCIAISFTNNTLSIADTGIGIASSDLPRIFDRGYTGYNGRRDKKATGLGLYITKKICDMLSINIRIESQIDVGTVVRLNYSADSIVDFSVHG